VSGYVQSTDRGQTSLLPPTVDEWISEANPVRVLDAFVRSLDFVALGFTRAIPNTRGRPAYDPRHLLALYLYGYLHRTRSSRRLERETRRNIEVMWLLEQVTPDHHTIADFRSQHPDALRQVFREFTVICRRLDLFGRELIGIDGTKIRAVNAKDRSFTPERLRELLDRIDGRIAEYLALLDTADGAEGAVPDRAAAASDSREALQAKLAALQDRQTEYRALAATLEETGATQVTLTDPESRRMKVKQGTEVCYNAQIAVDAEHHLLVAVDVTNEATDFQQLEPMARAAQAALAVKELSVLADAGYFNASGIAATVAAGMTPTMPAINSSMNTKAGRFTKEDFEYLPDQDAYRCPAKQILPLGSTGKNGARYYYNAGVCRDCPLRKDCTAQQNPQNGRMIKRGRHDDVLETMAARLSEAPELMLTRKALVEHPYGTIKRWDDGSYFLLRGLAKVRGEFSLMGLSYNLRRVITILGVAPLVAALRAGPGAGGPAVPLPVA